MSNLCFLSIQLCLFSFEHWQKMERVKYLYYFHFFQSGVPLMALMGIRLEGVVPAGILPLLLTMVRLEFSHIHLSCMPCMSEMSRHWAFRFCEIKKFVCCFSPPPPSILQMLFLGPLAQLAVDSPKGILVEIRLRCSECYVLPCTIFCI